MLKLYKFDSKSTIAKKIVIKNLRFLIDLKEKYCFLNLSFFQPDIEN